MSSSIANREIRIRAPSLLAVLRRAGRGFFDDRVLTLSASLSYYTLLSFAPLVLLALWLASTLGYDAQDALLGQIGVLAGSSARDAAEAVITSAEDHPSIGSMAGIFGLIISLGAASTVFGQLQSSLNAIWNIEARPGNFLWGWLRRRILSIGVIAAVGFVLIVSLIMSALIGVFLSNTGVIWEVINLLVGAAILAGLFMLLFRYLPDARLPWRHTIAGGVVTALLFTVGKSLIGLYLAKGSIGGAYGAAGSIVLLLVWVYYSSAIFFFGAEFVQALIKEEGREILTAEHGEKKFDS